MEDRVQHHTNFLKQERAHAKETEQTLRMQIALFDKYKLILKNEILTNGVDCLSLETEIKRREEM